MRYFMAFLMLTIANPVLANPVLANPVFARPGDAFNWQRARENYVALVDGSKQFQQLSALEQQELQEFRRRLREENLDTRSQRERCEDEQIAQLRSKQMTDLDRRHIDMVCRDESD